MIASFVFTGDLHGHLEDLLLIFYKVFTHADHHIVRQGSCQGLFEF